MTRARSKDLNPNQIQEYYLAVSKGNKKIEGIIVREDIDNRSYIVFHYVSEDTLFATIYITDNQITDIKLEFDDLAKTRGFSSWYDCANSEYQSTRNGMKKGIPLSAV